MSSQAVVENGKSGLLAKIERMNGFFGGWHSLLRGRNGRNKKLKREKKLASASFGREFRGRLMLEPLEERIVPAIGVIGFVGDANTGLAVSFNAGASTLVLSSGQYVAFDDNTAGSPDTLDYAAIVENGGDIGTGGAAYKILTNFGLTESGSLTFNDTSGADDLDAGNVANVSINTGVDFNNSGGGTNIAFGITPQVFTLNTDLTLAGVGAGFNPTPLGSDVTAISMNGSAGTVNFTNTTVGGTAINAVNIPTAASDKGDLDLITISGELTNTSTIFLGGIGSVFGDLNVTDVDGTGIFDVNNNFDFGTITIQNFGETTHRVDVDVSDTSLGGNISIASTGTQGTFGTLGTIITRALPGDPFDPITTDINIVGTVGSITTLNAGTIENNLGSVNIDDAIGTVLNVGGRITSQVDADDDNGGAGSFGNITVTNAGGLADGITGGGIKAGNGIGNIIVTGDIDASAPIITATGSIGNITVTGDLDAAVTATAGGIGNVQASSDITGVLTAGTSINNITATTGNITGAIAAGTSIGGITAGSAITSASIIAGTGSIGNVLAQGGSITSPITAGGSIGSVTADGATSDITGNLSAGEGIGIIDAQRDVNIVNVLGNTDGNTTGTGIAGIIAGRDIIITTLSTDDGADTAPTANLSIGNITAGDDIAIITIISGGDVNNITANGANGDAGGAGVEGFITIGTLTADGDIDTVTTTGAVGAGGTLTGTFRANAATATSPIATFIDANTGTTYVIDVTGPFTSAALFFDIGTATAGTVPNVALMNVAGTTSATNLSITTSDASFVDVIGIDVDDRDTALIGPPFFPPWPFAAVADPDGNVGGVEKEANLGNLILEGKLGTSADGGTGYAGLFAANAPGFIDFDTGAAPNNLGDVASIVIDNGFVAGSKIEVESLAALAIGNVSTLPAGLVLTAEATFTNIPGPIIIQANNGTTGLFFTKDQDGDGIVDAEEVFAQAIFLTDPAGGPIAQATIGGIDDPGFIDPEVPGVNYVVGPVALQGLGIGFESTQSVVSIVSDTVGPREDSGGTPFISFIEVAGGVARIETTDPDTTGAGAANKSSVGTVAIGFNIGIIGSDDPIGNNSFNPDVGGDGPGSIVSPGLVTPATFVDGDEFIIPETILAGGAGAGNSRLGRLLIDGDVGVGKLQSDIVVAVAGSLGGASGDGIKTFDTVTGAGGGPSADLLGGVAIGNDLTGDVVIEGTVNSDIIGVGVRKITGLGATGLAGGDQAYEAFADGAGASNAFNTFKTFEFASGSIGSAPDLVVLSTDAANTKTNIGSFNSGDMGNAGTDLLVAANDMFTNAAAGDDFPMDVRAIAGQVGGSGSFTAAGRPGFLNSAEAPNTQGLYTGDIIAGTTINSTVNAGVLPDGSKPVGNAGDLTDDGDITGSLFNSGNSAAGGGITSSAEFRAFDDITGVQIRAGFNTTLTTPAYNSGNMEANVRAGLFSVNGDIDPTTISAAGDVGLANGTTDIVASGDIKQVTIVAGASLAAAGNVNVDVLAGVTGAVVGLTISNADGTIGSGTFDGAGVIQDVVIRADGRVGTADGLRNIAAADGITKLAVVAEGAAWVLPAPIAGIAGSGSGLEFVTLGNPTPPGGNAAKADKNVLVSINAGADPADDDGANVLNTVAVIADNQVGIATEGFDYYRADGTIGDTAVPANGVTIIAGEGDSDANTTENINVNVLAGLEVDQTLSVAASDIGNLTMLADDNIGSSGDTLGTEDDGIFAARNITALNLKAGTGSISASTNDPGGSVLYNVIAGAAPGVSNPGSLSASNILADDDVGESPEGVNTIRAANNITGTNIIAGNATSPGGNIFADIIAGYKSNDPSSGTRTTGGGGAGNIINVTISADDDIGIAAQATVSDNGIILAGDDIANTTIRAGSGTQGRTNSAGGNIFVNIIAGFDGTGSIGNDHDGTTTTDQVLIEADDDVGATSLATPEGTNVIFASDDIGQLVGGVGGTVIDLYTLGTLASNGFDVAIDAGNTNSRGGNVFTDIIALKGNIIDTAVTADDNIGSTGQILGSPFTQTVVVPNVAGTITITVAADQIDSDGLATADNPQGIIQAGDYMEGLTVVAGEKSVAGDTANLTGGNVLMSIIAGADGSEGPPLTIRDLVSPDGSPNASGGFNHPAFDGINGLVLLADDDLGDSSFGDRTPEPGRAGNIISAADSIDITDMRAGYNLRTPGLDPDNTAAGQPDSAGDVSMDIIAGTRLFGPAGSATAIGSGISITSGPAIIADSGLPFARNINDDGLPLDISSPLPGPATMFDDKTTDGDQITILNLDIAKGGIFVPDLASTPDTAEGNGNLNGTFVAGSDITLISADINGNLVGNDGKPGGRTLIAGASYSGNYPNGVFLTVQLIIPGVFTGPFTAGTLVPFDMGVGSSIGTNAGPFQAGTVITTGTIQGEIQAGRFDGTGNGVVGANGITLAEVLAGTEGLADANFVPTTTFGATGDIYLDLLAIGRPFTSPQTTSGQEPFDFGDGDFVNFSMFAMNSIENDRFFTGGVVDDIKDGNITLSKIYAGFPAGITAKDAINLNFILANADAITAIDANINADGNIGIVDQNLGDPSTPSTLLPQNSAYGDLSANITALGHGDGAELPDGSSPDGISGGPIAAGFDPFVLIDSTVLPSNAPAGSVVQDPIVPANAFGSRYGNAFGFGNITGNILALDNDATDGLEQGDITVTWIVAGEDIDGDIGAQDDIALTGNDGTEGALIPGADLDIAAGLSSNGLLAAFGTSGDGTQAALTPGGDIDGNIVAGDDITTTDNTGDDAGRIFIAAQGGLRKGDIEGDIVSGAEDQIDDVGFVSPVGSGGDAVGGAGSNISALIIASVDVDGSILAGDPFGEYDDYFQEVGGGGFSDDPGAYFGSFTGTVVAGAGIDMIIDNARLASTYNLDNILDDGDINEVAADSDVTFVNYTISGLTPTVVLNGAIAVHDIGEISAGWGDPVATGIIRGNITAGDDIETILASKRIGSVPSDPGYTGPDLIAAGDDIDLIQAGDPSTADMRLFWWWPWFTLGEEVPTSAPFDIPLIDSVGTVAANIFTGGSLDTILAGGGKGAQLTDTNVNNDGITGNLYLGEFTGQHDLRFGEAGQLATLHFNDSGDANIVEIPNGDLSASLDMILTDGGGSNGVNGFTLSFNDTATGAPFSIDELIIADDLTSPIVVDQGSIGRLVIDDDAIDRLGAGQNARDAFHTKIALPSTPAIFFQLYDGDLSRTPMSRQFNEDDASGVGGVEYADMLESITVRDDIGLGPAVGEGEAGVFIEGSMRGATLESILGDIGNIHVGIDIYDSNIYAKFGEIGNIFVGDDIQGTASGGVDIIADLGIGDIEVQDSIIGNVTIQAISGSIGDITVGTDVDFIGDPAAGETLTDANGLGIDGNGVSGGVDILAGGDIGDITVVHGNITDDVNIQTDVSYFGDIGDIVVLHGDISRGVTIEADSSIGNISVGILPLPGPDGIFGTADDEFQVLVNDEGICEIRQGVHITARLGGIGNITVANDMEEGVFISASEGGIGEIRVFDDLQHGVYISTAGGSGGGLAGLFVGADLAEGVWIDIDGAINQLTQTTGIGDVTGAVLVGGSILGSVSIQAAAIGATGNALVVGINGVGNIDPKDDTITIRARGTNGKIGNITVRDVIGSQSASGGGDVTITSEDGSIGNIVAGRISPVSGNVLVTARNAIGDIVTLDDAVEGITNTTLRVTSATGSIGDIIAHGDITDLSFADFDGSIGDIVSLNGSVEIIGPTFGGSIGDIFASEDIDIADLVVEDGDLGADGDTNNTSLLTLTDTSFDEDDPTFDLSTLTVEDGLGRARPDGAPKDGIYSEAGDITITSVTVGGSIGDIQAPVGCIEIDSLKVSGSVGDVKAFEDVTIGGEGGAVLIGEDLGSVLSQTGNIFIEVVVNGNIEDIYAEEFNILGGSSIYAGGNIGNFTSGTGVRAGSFIEDDIVIVAKGTIGVIEGRIIGFDDIYDVTLVTTPTLVEDNDGILDTNDILIPDGDGIFDFQNDLMAIEDSNGDNIIEISPVIRAFMAASGGSDLLDDGFINSEEAKDIILFAEDYLQQNGWISDYISKHNYSVEPVPDIILFQEIFKEVKVIDVDTVVDVPEVIDKITGSTANDILTIIAYGPDPIGGRAIGAIRAQQDITTDVLIDATTGGIGTIQAGGILGLKDVDPIFGHASGGFDHHHGHGNVFVLPGPDGLFGTDDDVYIEKGSVDPFGTPGGDAALAIIRAKTSIDTIQGDDAIINLDIQVTGGITIDPTKPLNQMITTTGGVGLVGGIVSGGDIEIKVVTGGSIGYTVATGGSINNNYDAFGNIGSIIAKDNITGTYTAAMGYIGNGIIGSGQTQFIRGGVLAASGDINADFKAGLGTGNISAPLGNVSGSLVTGGVLRGENTPYVNESGTADDEDFPIIISPAVLEQFTVHVALDTNSSTPLPPAPSGITFVPGSDPLLGDTIQFVNSHGVTQTISVEGSSSGLTVNVGVAFGSVTDVAITGSGSLVFDSTGNVGTITVAGGSVSVSSVVVDGDLGGFININKNAKIANIKAEGNIGSVIGYGLVQNITAGESIGEVKSLWKDVKNVFAGEDIDKIFAYNNVQNIGAQGRIGEIIAGKDVKIVHASEIGTISAANVSKVYAIGDIDLISASGNVTDVSSGGDIEVVAGKNATRISGASGSVSVGGKASRVSYNLEILRPPKVPCGEPVVVYVDP